jgi:hypothetical protein
MQPFNVIGSQRTDDFCRIAKNQGTRRNLAAGRNNRPSPDQALFSNLRTIQDNGAHANKGKRMNRTRMRDDIVGNRHTVAKKGRNAATEHMNRRVILDIDAVADANVTDVAPHDGVKPDTRLIPNVHIADDMRALLNVGAGADLGCDAVMRQNHAVSPIRRAYIKALAAGVKVVCRVFSVSDLFHRGEASKVSSRGLRSCARISAFGC